MEKKKVIANVILLLRPHHYIKNLFVFLPLFFAGQFSDVQQIFDTTVAFISFCLIASSVYVFNDIQDAPEDRTHPVNKNRPIALGLISNSHAYILDIVLSLGALVLSYLQSHELFYIILGYKFLNIAYTLVLKKIPIIDLMIVSLGFVLRLFAGSVVTDVFLTEWIIILTFLLSMMLALGKRRNDTKVFEAEGKLLRSSVKAYNLTFLNYIIIIISSVIIVAYIMYTLSPETCERIGTNKLYITSFWVLAGIIRYLQQIFVLDNNDNPVRLLIKDHPLKLILLAWIINFLFFIYIV